MGPLCCLLHQKPPKKNFFINLTSFLSLYAASSNFKQTKSKQKNESWKLGHKTWPFSFWSHFRSLLTLKPQNKTFPQIYICVNLGPFQAPSGPKVYHFCKLDETLTWSKKSKIFYTRSSREKLHASRQTDNWTHKQMDKLKNE